MDPASCAHKTTGKQFPDAHLEGPREEKCPLQDKSLINIIEA